MTKGQAIEFLREGGTGRGSYSSIMARAFSYRYRWHKRFVPMPDSPKVASRLMRTRAVFAVSVEVQFVPNAVAVTRRFASH